MTVIGVTGYKAEVHQQNHGERRNGNEPATDHRRQPTDLKTHRINHEP